MATAPIHNPNMTVRRTQDHVKAIDLDRKNFRKKLESMSNLAGQQDSH